MGKRKIIVVVGVLLLIAVAVWVRGYLTSPPATAEFTWPSSSGGFVQYTVSDEAATSLLVSMLPEEDVSMTSHESGGWGLTSQRLTIKPRSGSQKDIELSGTATAIFADREGDISAEKWPVSRQQFQELIELLKSAPVDKATGTKDSLSAVRQFFQNSREIPVPANLKDFVNNRQDGSSR